MKDMPEMSKEAVQEVQNTMMDRAQEKERKAYEESAKAENRAPMESVKRMYDKLRGAMGAEKPVKKAKGGTVSSASKRADGIAQRGKTRGRMC